MSIVGTQRCGYLYNQQYLFEKDLEQQLVERKAHLHLLFRHLCCWAMQLLGYSTLAKIFPLCSLHL